MSRTSVVNFSGPREGRNLPSYESGALPRAQLLAGELGDRGYALLQQPTSKVALSVTVGCQPLRISSSLALSLSTGS